MKRNPIKFPTVVESETVYENAYFIVRIIKQLMPNGSIAKFFVRDEPDVAVCLPVTSAGEFILLKEYRPGPMKFLMEIPGGCVDEGEHPEVAARREVGEEVGFDGDIIYLASTYISAYSSARKHLFLMRNAVRIREPVQEPQDIAEVHAVGIEDFQALIREGNMSDLDGALAALRYLGL